MIRKVAAGLAVAAMALGSSGAASARSVRPSMLVFSPSTTTAAAVSAPSAPVAGIVTRAHGRSSDESNLLGLGFVPLLIGGIVIIAVVVVAASSGHSSSPG